MVLDLQNKWVQRMIVMVDIRDLKHLNDPRSCLAAIGACVDKLLLSCNNDQVTTVWAYKLLDSSMTPYRSRSKIEQTVGRWASHVHFESINHTQTFVSALKCLANTDLARPLDTPQGFAHGSVESIARSMQELVHDYVWEPLVFDDVFSGKQKYFSGKSGNSNLVVLFSALPRTREDFRRFTMDQKSCIPASMSDEQLLKNFSSKFGPVNEAFGSRDIHFCWVDIPRNVSAQEIMGCNEMCKKTVLGAFKTMGWSFISMDTLLLASKLVPFSLIWPIVAYPRAYPTQCRGNAEVNLELEDIDGKALLCKVCEVQWIDLNPAEELNSLEDISCIVAGVDLSALVWSHSQKILDHDRMKIHVRELFRMEKCPDVSRFVTDRVLLRGVLGKKKKGRSGHETNAVETRDIEEEIDRDLIGDEMLERLQQENGEFKQGKPAWQLLLVFLSREKCLALVTVSDGKTLPFDAILEPLTVHAALLNVLDSSAKLSVQITSTNIDPKKDQSVQISTRIHEAPKNCESDTGFANDQSSSHGQKLAWPISDCSASKKPRHSESLTFTKSKKCSPSEKGFHLHCNSWDSLYAAIIGGLCEVEHNLVSVVNLESRYTNRSCRQSKILRFMSRWMRKSSRKLNLAHSANLQVSQLESNTQLVEENNTVSDFVSEEALQSVPECNQYCAVPAVAPFVASAGLSMEAGDSNSALVIEDDAKAFIGSLCEKIQNGLCNKEVDLKALAKCLVDVLIKTLQVQLEEEHSLSGNVERIENSTESLISDQVMKLLLKKPKELATKYKGCLLPLSGLQPDDSAGSSEYTSEDKVREHELQMLFRMEILASKVAGTLEEHVKEKLIKEICRLLENIQFNLPGGVLTGESLIEFAGRALASRYIDSLEQVIDKIYKRMEFYAIDDSEGILNSISNNEKDGDMHGIEEDAQPSSQNELMVTVSGEGSNQGQLRKLQFQVSSAEEQCPENLLENHDVIRIHVGKHDTDGDYEIKLKKAQAKRERAQRFAHFSSRAPNLQRVWTPKQPTQIKKKQCKTHGKLFRKKHKKDAENDVIYETPIQTTKIRKHIKDGKKGLVGENQTSVVVDVVHETPFPTSKVQNHMQQGKAMKIDYPNSITSTGLVTSGMDLNSGSISRALFGQSKLLPGSVFTQS